MSGHTPGPWFLIREVWSGGSIQDRGGCFSIVDSADRNTANVICSRSPWEEKALELDANAHLIAAAPDLLAALEESIEDSEEVLALHVANYGESYRAARMKAMRDRIAKGRAAIARATGKQQ